ncbi:hypothetical protein OQZ33_05320 [Pedobacter sp. MC2016-05]|uniref:IS66 family insertion sequence element accessory protein TnpA n=1 Tax=Pedobacter sp. MC2016-05 TaxID=2994474 RepID=UPI002247F0A4|nr:hypothetical protein [Pedobacter sp. MC2016-05]MCX2473742.1 hypothetical protein [Pedobacter sp. MC2016-05]
MNQPKNYTLSERANFIDQWKASKLDLRSFSKQCGVPLTSLRYWVYGKKPKVEKPKLTGFLPVHVSEAYNSELEVILDLPTGMRMTLRGALTPSYLKALIS